MSTAPIIAPKKLIEVALPLEDVNRASAKEKSIKHGHPSTLHLWWARRPLATARAVLFAQLVNDPSWKYSDEELKKNQIKGAITKKRNELFKLVSELVQWENTTNEEVLERARREIRASWKETCEANKTHPEAKIHFTPDKLPAFHDPFAGGGSLPLEAQRLGLDAHASDLNPVAVLINKAMLEVPARFVGQAPVGPLPPGAKQVRTKATDDWSRCRGLAEDVRRYGTWIRDEAFRRLGHMYPPVLVTREKVRKRPDLKRYEGRTLRVVAWIWARSVASSNPAAKGVHIPLTTTWFLSKKDGAESWIEPVVSGHTYRLVIKSRLSGAEPPADTDGGTKEGRGANFRCLLTGSLLAPDYIKSEGDDGRLGKKLLAIVAEGDGGRVYIEPDIQDEVLATTAKPAWSPTETLNFDPRAIWCPQYGLRTYAQLFTERQLLVMTTYADLVGEARNRVIEDAKAFGGDARRFHEGGKGAIAYGDTVALYLAFLVAAASDDMTTLVTWRPTHGTGATRTTFARQGLPMTWDFAEVNPFAGSSGDLVSAARSIAMVLDQLPSREGHAYQADAAEESNSGERFVVSADPPYYDNIGYADLSDFFYVWHRRMLRDVFPDLFGTILVPKAEELVAAPYRQGGKQAAEKFFLLGMSRAMGCLIREAHPAFPITLYYAFKQSEKETDGVTSTGWETFLSALISSGLCVTGTWPVRTERSGKITSGTNILASSIVLSCRPRPVPATSVPRREFMRELERHLPLALSDLTSDPMASIAPVDLQQAAIGPGMAIFSRHEAVLEADGSAMTVRNALSHIIKAIDDFFAHAEGELDADTRFCVGWFQQYGFESGLFGDADVLARAKGTSVDGVRDAGVLAFVKGKVRLFRMKEYPKAWDPTKDDRIPVWEACHHMCRALGESEHEAGSLLARMPEKQDAIRQLAYRLYTICERQKWAEEARLYNELITSWPAIVEQSHAVGHKGMQLELI